MKNLFLIIAITFVGLANAQDVKVIENLKNEENQELQDLRVLCVKGYVFIEQSNGNLVQFLKWSRDAYNTRALASPLLCGDYKKLK